MYRKREEHTHLQTQALKAFNRQVPKKRTNKRQ